MKVKLLIHNLKELKPTFKICLTTDGYFKISGQKQHLNFEIKLITKRIVRIIFAITN